MTQLRNLILTALISAAFNAGASTLKGTLDFSHLYGNSNAGKYDVSLQLNSARSATLQVSQQLVYPPAADQPGSEPMVCMTEVKLVAGTYDFKMTDLKTLQSQTLTQGMPLFTYFYDDSEKCTSPAELLKSQPSFSPYFNLGTFSLNYKAPFDYEKMDVALSVFPYGYSVNLEITQNSRGELIVENLDTQLAGQIRRGNKDALSYYVYATQNQTTLSLGNGFIELK